MAGGMGMDGGAHLVSGPRESAKALDSRNFRRSCWSGSPPNDEESPILLIVRFRRALVDTIRRERAPFGSAVVRIGTKWPWASSRHQIAPSTGSPAGRTLDPHASPASRTRSREFCCSAARTPLKLLGGTPTSSSMCASRASGFSSSISWRRPRGRSRGCARGTGTERRYAVPSSRGARESACPSWACI